MYRILAAALALILGSCSPGSEREAVAAPLLNQSSPLAAPPGWSPVATLASVRSGHTATLLPSGKLLVVGGNGSSGALASAELFDPGSNSWASAGSLSQGRKNHTATLLASGQVLVVGGEGPSGPLTSAELYEPATGSWTTVGALLEARGGHTATLLASGQVLVVGGAGTSGALTSAELYDAASGIWTATGSLAEARSGATATLLASGQVLVTGGQGLEGALASAELYDAATGTWAATGSLAEARSGAIATRLLSGKVLVAGGQGSNGPLASAQLYDPATGTWAATGSLTVARSDATATLLPSGQVLVAGGQGPSSPLFGAEVYAPATGSWSAAFALIQGRALHTATLLPSGKVLVTGGLGTGGTLATAELYYPAAGSWTGTGPAQNRQGHAATLLPSGKVLVVGGYYYNPYGSSNYLNSAELYDPATGTWTATGSMAQRRNTLTATLLPSGKVLVVGGFNDLSHAQNSAELYDPATGTWTATGSLAQGRYDHTATLLASGQVLVVGGQGSGVLTSAELYNPATGTWTGAGSLAEGRFDHTATLLPSGQVLITGGYSNNGSRSKAELYNPATGTWTAAGSLAQSRHGHTATLMPSGKVFVVGGSSYSDYKTSVEVFDPATFSWTQGPSLNAGLFDHSAVLLPSGRLLLVGGFDGNSSVNCEMYDPATGSWTVSPPLPQGYYKRTATVLPSGQVLVAGGSDQDPVVYDDTGALSTGRPELVSVSPSASLATGNVFTVNGSRLRGGSEASNGSSRSSPTDFPLLTLMDLERGRLAVLPPLNFSSTHVTAKVPWVLPGQHLLSVTVNGVTSSTVLSIAMGVDTEPPTATLTAPAAGSTLKGTVTLSATASDNLTVARVEFYDGATLLGTDTTAPYSLSWNTATSANGAHVLSVKAYDMMELSGTSPGVSVTLDNDQSAPTVAISAPTAGATVTDIVSCTATATDNLGVARVDFYEGTTFLGSDPSSPYTCTWSTRSGPNGSRTLTAKAYDAAGNVGIAQVTVNADNDFAPPTVTLTAPAPGATLTGIVDLTAAASDDRAVARVDFFVGTTLVGSDSAAPYSISYNTRGLPNGAKVLTARAYDTLGTEGTSPSVNVTFSNDLTPPTATLTGLGSGATLKNTVTLSANASDNVAVTRVEFYDGATLLGTVTTAPYFIQWDTRTVANGAHTLYAKAYDAVEQVGTSPGLNVTVSNDAIAPTVSFSAPAAGATVAGTVACTAAASDNVGVVRVEFFEGTTFLGGDTTAPFTYSWNTRTGSNGSRTLTAKAYDTAENFGTAEVTVNVDNDFTPPTVTLTGPVEGATVSGTITLTATASDDRALSKVAFFVGTTQVGIDSAPSYSFSYNTRNLPNGPVVLTAKAYDAAGNVSTSAPVNVTFENDFTLPTVALTSPAEGETLTGTVVLTATASDDRAMSRVAFFVGTSQVGSDSTAPYSFSYNTRSLSNGTKVLTAKAYDAAGNVATSTAVNVTFENDFTPPTVALTSPAEGETLTGTVVFTATASATSGISKVVYFVGPTQLGSVTTAPYSFSYNTRGMINGAKVLTAKAYDTLGNVGTSAPVNVTFSNDLTLPTTSITSPASGTTVSGVVQLDAIASDDRGTIAKVDFYQGALLLGTDTTAPYTWSWDTTKASTGTQTLKSRAWDAAGNSAYSTGVTVTVTR